MSMSESAYRRFAPQSHRAQQVIRCAAKQLLSMHGIIVRTDAELLACIICDALALHVADPNPVLKAARSHRAFAAEKDVETLSVLLCNKAADPSEETNVLLVSKEPQLAMYIHVP